MSIESIDKLVEFVTSKFGAGSAMLMSDKAEDLSYVSTGSIEVDEALGGQGLPLCRLVNFIGKEAAGKTTMAIHVLIECQKMGGRAVLIETEEAFSYDRSEKMGLDLSKTLIIQPETVEKAFAAIKALTDGITSKKGEDKPTVIVWDSFSGTPTKSDIDADIEASKNSTGASRSKEVGSHARVASFNLRHVPSDLVKANCLLIVIHQIKQNIMVGYGSPDTFLAERPFKFHSSVGLRVARKGNVVEKNEIVGITSKVKVIKNKVAPPFRECEVDIYFDRGYDRASQLLKKALLRGIVIRAGGWLSYKENKFRANEFDKILLDNVDLEKEILLDGGVK